MTDGLNSRSKEWSRPPEPHPPDAGCWCSRNKRRPYVSLIWCSTPSGHRNGLRPWIRSNGRRTDHEPLNLTLDAYLAQQGQAISRAQAQERMFAKLANPRFLTDMRPLLPAA